MKKQSPRTVYTCFNLEKYIRNHSKENAYKKLFKNVGSFIIIQLWMHQQSPHYQHFNVSFNYKLAIIADTIA